MKTLVVHPDDRSTDFLCAIYDGKGYDVIRRWVSGPSVEELIPQYDRVIMLGHGSPLGLFSMGCFPGPYAIDERHVEALGNKRNIYIWCHANQFVIRHNLFGFSSGMFISEVIEAAWYGIKTSRVAVQRSNDLFASLLGMNLDEPDLFDKVHAQYQLPCPVVDFNRDRLLEVL